MSRVLEYARPRSEDGRPGDTLIRGKQTIKIRRRPNGRMFLFQETPNRKYLSGLMPKPEHGHRVYLVDFLRPDGWREFFYLELGDDRATLRTAKYNNSGSGQNLSAPARDGSPRMSKMLR